MDAVGRGLADRVDAIAERVHPLGPGTAPLGDLAEPELMDTEKDAVEYDAMDFWEADTRFAEDAIALLHGHGAQVLDIGCGTGKVPVLMLERRGDLDILAIDLAKEMLRVAARRVADAGFSDRCKLACMDAKNLRVPAAKYDLVIANSTITANTARPSSTQTDWRFRYMCGSRPCSRSCGACRPDRA